MGLGRANSREREPAAACPRSPAATHLAIREFGALLLSSVNKIVLLGFSYAAALVATTFVIYLNRVAKDRFPTG
jgi:hypothetical protein